MSDLPTDDDFAPECHIEIWHVIGRGRRGRDQRVGIFGYMVEAHDDASAVDACTEYLRAARIVPIRADSVHRCRGYEEGLALWTRRLFAKVRSGE